MNPKPIWASKTVWFNLLTTLLGVITAWAQMDTFKSILPYLAAINVVGNVILRVYFTSRPIGNPPAQ